MNDCARYVLLRVFLAIGLAIAHGASVQTAAAQTPVFMMQGHVERDPTGAYSILWDGNQQVYILTPQGALPPFPVADLLGRGVVQITYPYNNPLPILAQFDGQMFQVAWLTRSINNGTEQGGYTSPEGDPAAKLNKIQQENMRMQCALWGC